MEKKWAQLNSSQPATGYRVTEAVAVRFLGGVRVVSRILHRPEVPIDLPLFGRQGPDETGGEAWYGRRRRLKSDAGRKTLSSYMTALLARQGVGVA